MRKNSYRVLAAIAALVVAGAIVPQVANAAILSPLGSQLPTLGDAWNGLKNVAGDHLPWGIDLRTPSDRAAVERPRLGPEAARTPGKKHYIAIGDSYAAGEGAPAEVIDSDGETRELYYAGTADPDNKCHRSPEAHPALLWQKLGTREWSFDFRACSGAKTDNLLNPQKEWFKYETDGTGNPAQWSVDTAEPANLVTFKMGGNVLQFSDIVTDCLRVSAFNINRNDDYNRKVRDDWFDYVNTRIPGCSEKWDRIIDPKRGELHQTLLSTFESIKPTLKDSGGQLIVSGYPRPFRDDPPNRCNLGNGPGSIDRTDMLWLNSVADRLNQELRNAAIEAGVSYVDVTHLFTEEFNGGTPGPLYHDICVDDNEERWINRLIPTHLERSAHPRPPSHALEAELISRCHQNPVYCDVAPTWNSPENSVTLPECAPPTGPGLGTEVVASGRHDLTGDGYPEAVVSFSCVPSTSSWPERVIVFDGKDQQRRLGTLINGLDEYDPPDLRVDRFDFHGRSIVVTGTTIGAGSNAEPEFSFTQEFTWNGNGFDPGPLDASRTAGDACPAEAAENIQEADVSLLLGSRFMTVDAFGYICQGLSGQFYYYGADRDDPERDITLRAELAPDGSFSATNDGYTYVLGNGTLVIRKQGRPLSEQPLLDDAAVAAPVDPCAPPYDIPEC